jgi:hypothetical protein
MASWGRMGATIRKIGLCIAYRNSIQYNTIFLFPISNIQYSQRGSRIFRVPTAVKIDHGIDYVFQVNRVLIGGRIIRHLFPSR